MRDAEDLLRVYGDPEVMRFASDSAIASRAAALRVLASMRTLLATRESIEWGLRLRRGGRIVGTCGFHSFSPGRQVAEVGCLLARRYWGRGLMQEALRAMFVFGREQLKLRRLLANVDQTNLRSRRLFAALGFETDPHGLLSLNLLSLSRGPSAARDRRSLSA